jgi:hypothetical protein
VYVQCNRSRLFIIIKFRSVYEDLRYLSVKNNERVPVHAAVLVGAIEQVEIVVHATVVVAAAFPLNVCALTNTGIT